MFAPACLAWDTARYRAEKLFLSVDLALSAQVVDRLPTDALRRSDPRLQHGQREVAARRAPLTPAGAVVQLKVDMDGPGWRTFRGDWVLDADSGAVLQYASVRQPSPRYRVYRFTPLGPDRITARPAAGEEALPPQSWSDIETRERQYGTRVAGPVQEISTLVYLLAASALHHPGDRLALLGYATSADALFDLTVTAGALERLAVDYRVSDGANSVDRRQVIDVLPLTLTGRPRSSDPEQQVFDLLGLRDVTFLIDPDYRVVVGLRARVPAVGEVQFQLLELELAKTSHPAACASRGARPE
ncbi:MAG: hypothetical protein ACKOBM_11465 [Gammaproteobacteria bacterium]